MRRTFKEVVIILLAIIAVIYIINPTAGIIELIPDNIPIIGNLDEAAAVAIIINTLSYYGYDFANLYSRSPRKRVVRRIVSNTDTTDEA